MKSFAGLYLSLDQTNKTNVKVEELQEYFSKASDNDKLWLLAFFSGRKLKRPVNATQLREWCSEKAEVEPWLFEECYQVVGDLAETIALILPDQPVSTSLSLSDCIERIRSMDKAPDEIKKQVLFDTWDQLSSYERFVFNKLITGSFRIGVSQKLVSRALSKHTGIEENLVAHRLMGNWSPDTHSFQSLILESNISDDHSRPYPFYLAYALEAEPETLGDIKNWQAEWKWDGIRGQIIKRGGSLYVWSRGEELVTGRFPEYNILEKILPDGTVLDGEILPFKNGKPLPFQQLQTRINRKTTGKKLLEDVPVIFMAYDILEYNGTDIRNMPMAERRTLLEEVIGRIGNQDAVILSPLVNVSSWDELMQVRSNSREELSEGIMLKDKTSVYDVGRKKGSWWKWKIDPLTVDAVLIYAQSGHGRRAGLYTDYTFALWHEGSLVPFAKAYSGLTDDEIRKVDSFVRRNTKEKFGPVRSVLPELVFELAFEGINLSSRHKSGVAVRFPRILRWRTDKKPEEANTLDELKALIPSS